MTAIRTFSKSNVFALRLKIALLPLWTCIGIVLVSVCLSAEENYGPPELGELKELPDEWCAEWAAGEDQPHAVNVRAGVWGCYFATPPDLCIKNLGNCPKIGQIHFYHILWKENQQWIYDEGYIRDLPEHEGSFIDCLDVVAQNGSLRNLGGWDIPFDETIADKLAEITTLRELILAQDLFYGDSMFVEDSDYPLIARLHRLRSLTVSGPDITGKGISALRTMPHLQSLSLHDSAVNDDAMTEVATIRSLEHLNLIETQVTSKGLEHLREMDRLYSLALSHIDQQTADVLTSLPHLTNLELMISGFSQKDAVALSGLDGLESLILTASLNDNQVMQFIPKMQKLKELEIDSWTSLSEESLLAVSSCRQLRRLSLIRIRGVTAEGLARIVDLPEIKDLSLGAFWRLAEDPDPQSPEDYCGLSREMCEVLSRATELESLYLPVGEFEPGALDSIARMKHLRRLALRVDEMDYEEMLFLTKLPALEELVISWDFEYDDAAVSTLARIIPEMKQLRVLHIKRGRFSEQELLTLHASLPEEAVLRYGWLNSE